MPLCLLRRNRPRKSFLLFETDLLLELGILDDLVQGIAFMIYDYFRVTGAHDTVLDYTVLFSVILRDDNVQKFDTRWDEVFLSMSKKSIR